MANIFKRFEGLTVRIQIINGMGLPIDHQGVVEVEEGWAFLYTGKGDDKKYKVAINTNKNNVVSVEVMDHRQFER